MTGIAPAMANALAKTRPSPCPAPVTIATRPRSDGSTTARRSFVVKLFMRASRRPWQGRERRAGVPRLPPDFEPEIAGNDAGADVARPARDRAAGMRGRARIVEIRN